MPFHILPEQQPILCLGPSWDNENVLVRTLRYATVSRRGAYLFLFLFLQNLFWSHLLNKLLLCTPE